MRGHATRHDAPENFIMGPRTVTQQPYRRANSKSGQTNELTNTPSRLVKRISFQFLMHIIGCFDEQMPRLCSTIYFCCDRRKKYVMSPISCSCTTITDGLNYFVKTILGKLLFVLVFALISINLTASCFIIIPYELLYKSSLFVAFLAILGLYVAVNVSFHYYMAACTSPGSPVESDLLPRCFKCGGHKPERTHHCSFCDICVLNMVRFLVFKICDESLYNVYYGLITLHLRTIIVFGLDNALVQKIIATFSHFLCLPSLEPLSTSLPRLTHFTTIFLTHTLIEPFATRSSNIYLGLIIFVIRGIDL